MSCLARGKRATGIGEKPSDRWAVPLCADCHLDGPEAQHKIGEEKFWRCANLDPFAIALRLWTSFERRRNRPPSVRKKVRARTKRLKRRVERRASDSQLKTRGPKRKWPSRPFPKGRKLEWKR